MNYHDNKLATEIILTGPSIPLSSFHEFRIKSFKWIGRFTAKEVMNLSALLFKIHLILYMNSGGMGRRY